MPTMVPVMIGKNMRIDGENFRLEIFDVNGNVNDCIALGQEIMEFIIYNDMSKVTKYIKEKFDLYSELTYL